MPSKRCAAQASPCAHPASITVDPSSNSPHAGQHFCVMCGARLSKPVAEVEVPADSNPEAAESDSGRDTGLGQQTEKLGRHNPLDCREVGITEYSTDRHLRVEGGSIKSRCTDFVVEEVRWDGSVVSVHSTDLDPKNSFGYWHRGEGPQDAESTQSSTDLNSDNCTNIEPSGDDTLEGIDVDNEGTDEGYLYEPNNTRFILVKANCSTFEAIRLISEATGLASSRFTMAGLKDTKAVTAQEIIAIGVPASKLVGCVNGNPRLRLVLPQTERPTRDRLFPGACQGNRFQIVLRDVPVVPSAASDRKSSLAHRKGPAAGEDGNDVVCRIVQQLQERGFVNYFGEQRFGGNTTRNTDIGKMYLKRNYIGVVNATLGPAPWGNARSSMEAKAREIWKESHGSVLTVRKLMPKTDDLHVENLLLDRLGRAVSQQKTASLTNEVCRAAWLSVPFMDRLLMVNAYFSKVWNLMASTKLRRHGTSVIEGDLVKVEPPSTQCTGKCSDATVCHCTATKANGRKRFEIKVVTAEDVVQGTYSIRDVVLPLPGDQIQFPENDIGSLYRSYLMYDETLWIGSIEKDDIGNEHFMPGCYRNLMGFAQNLAVACTDLKGIYEDDFCSTIEEMKMIVPGLPAQIAGSKNKLTQAGKDQKARDEAAAIESETQDDGSPMLDSPSPSSGETRSYRLQFQLGSGMYATMLLREIAKAPQIVLDDL